MLLDEATNWLDNQSQARVMQNLAILTSTRIVIAHRLSTLEQADRIYVLQAGKVCADRFLQGTHGRGRSVQGAGKAADRVGPVDAMRRKQARVHEETH